MRPLDRPTENAEGSIVTGRWPVGVAALGGAALACAVFFPGVMSPDSLEQYREALTGEFVATFRPPIMSAIWFVLVRLIPGPLGLVLFHQLLFWGGLVALALACRFSTAQRVAVVLGVGLFPPVFALLGHVWKDMGFGAALMAATGLTALAARSGSRRVQTLAWLALFYGAAVRFNSVAAVIPLAAALIQVAPGKAALSRSRLASVTLLSTLGLYVAATLIGWALDTRTGPHYPGTVGIQMSMLHDLEGISVVSGQNRLPAWVDVQFPRGDLEALRRDYDPTDINRFVWRDPPLLTQSPEAFAALVDAWTAAVATHPDAWLLHRARVMSSMLQLGSVYYPYHGGIDANPEGLTFRGSALTAPVMAALDASVPFTFRGWVCVVLCLALAVWARRKHGSLVPWVAGSGVLYVSTYALSSTGSDFRYVWWLFVATGAAVVLALAERKGLAPRLGQTLK
jgi:hypothetical protein